MGEPLSTTRALEALPKAFLTSVDAKTMVSGGCRQDKVRRMCTICSAPHESMAPVFWNQRLDRAVFLRVKDHPSGQFERGLKEGNGSDTSSSFA